MVFPLKLRLACRLRAEQWYAHLWSIELINCWVVGDLLRVRADSEEICRFLLRRRIEHKLGGL